MMERNLYRFVSFFELYDLLSNNKMKMSRLSLMSDKNEGLGDVLKFQESISFSWGVRSQEEFIKFHESVRGRTYISSWTSAPDLMAMWLLYSSSQDSIRIKTTQKKLETHLQQYWKENYWTKHLDSPVGTIQLDGLVTVDDVEYVSFEDISRKIQGKYEEYRTILGEELNDIKNFKVTPKLKEQMDKIVIETKNGALLKDEAYTHEKEVRALFNLCLRNDVSKEKYKELVRKDDMSAVFGTATCDYPESSVLPETIKISVSDTFVESICFDPRMPKYKKESYLDALSPYIADLEIENSHAFGYKPDEYSFSIDS